jgi:hypothetical protein
MANEEVSIRQLVSRVQIGSFRGYLIDRGWSEKPSRYVDHVYFQGAVHDGGARYDLYLPTSPDVPKYHATLMRAIYKLCGIEDREPQDIARDVIATKIAVDRPAAGSAGKTRLRISNSGSSALQLRIDSPLREHEMLPGEAIELVCDVASSGSLEIEHGDGSLTILTSGRR